jgi:hypothetical protein
LHYGMTYHTSNQEFRAFAVQSKLNRNSHMTTKFASNPPIRDHDRTESPGNAYHLTTELPHLTDAPPKSDSPELTQIAAKKEGKERIEALTLRHEHRRQEPRRNAVLAGEGGQPCGGAPSATPAAAVRQDPRPEEPSD